MRPNTERARPLTALWRASRARPHLAGLYLFIVLSGFTAAYLSVVQARPSAFPMWLVLVTGAIVFRHRLLPLAVLIITTAMMLRLQYIGIGFADQITVSQSAWDRVLAGGNPYGAGYMSTTPPGSPFPYGPLALVWWLPGPIVEGFAAAGLMGLLAWRRAWLTLAVLGGWGTAIAMTFHGGNDYWPALLIALAVVLLPTHPRWAGATLAVAIGLKPYAVAWLLPFIGAGAGLTAVIGTLLLWSPLLLVWGIPSFLGSVELAANLHNQSAPDQALNLPLLRWLAVPFALLGLAARRWEDAVLLGSAAFILFLFLDRWASTGYWVAVIPPVGLALEARVFGAMAGEAPARLARTTGRPARRGTPTRAQPTARSANPRPTRSS